MKNTHRNIFNDHVVVGLSRGLAVMIDKEDLPLIQGLNWYATKDGRKSYAVHVRKKGCTGSVLMHRIIMGDPVDMEVDHINGNGLDNRKINLRVCSKTENQHNRRARLHGTSGYKGVWKEEGDYPRWRAEIRDSGRRIRLGSFRNEDDAARAYNDAAIKYHGEFALLNEIEE